MLTKSYDLKSNIERIDLRNKNEAKQKFTTVENEISLSTKAYLRTRYDYDVAKSQFEQNKIRGELNRAKSRYNSFSQLCEAFKRRNRADDNYDNHTNVLRTVEEK